MPDLSEQTQSDRRRICSRTQVEDSVAQYFIEHQEWSVPQRTTEYWQGRFPGSHIHHVVNILSRASDEASVVKVIARELPDKLRVHPFVVTSVNLEGECFSPGTMLGCHAEFAAGKAAVAHYLPSQEVFDRQRSRYSPVVVEAAFQELTRLFRALQNDDVRALIKTNIQNVAKLATDSLVDKLVGKAKFTCKDAERRFRTVVVGVVHERPLAVPIRPETELKIETLAQERFGRLAGSEVKARFEALRAPNWPKYFT